MKIITILIIATLTFVAAAYAEIKVNVLGAVNRQGHFVIEEENITLLDVIALAEGISKQGDSKKIIIRKAGEKVTVVEIDLMQIVRGKIEDPAINDGDLVYVSERLF